jgi:hypothetical protein
LLPRAPAVHPELRPLARRAGVIVAGVGDHGKAWELARGWARLDPHEPLSTTHRFPVYAISTLITATAVLRLVALTGPVVPRPTSDVPVTGQGPSLRSGTA